MTTTDPTAPATLDEEIISAYRRDGVIDNAVWEYQQPYESVGEIAGHVAFYPSKVQISTSG